ncbi:MAG: hypothetical protein RSA29_02715 [Clostridium sp.]
MEIYTTTPHHASFDVKDIIDDAIENVYCNGMYEDWDDRIHGDVTEEDIKDIQAIFDRILARSPSQGADAMQVLCIKKGDILLKNISKLSDKCRKCLNIDKCNNKKMVGCAVVVPMITQHSQPVMRAEHTISINMGEYEEIAEKLKKDLYKNLYCSFNS